MAGMINNLPGSRGSRAAVNKRRVLPSPQPMLPGFGHSGRATPLPGPVNSIPKRRVMGSGQPFLPGFNPRNAPGSAMDRKRTIMTPKRMAGIDAARARSAAAKLGGVDTGMMHGPPMPQAGKMKMSKRSLLGIGLGMGVAAGVAMNRRGEGASSGRQSIYKY